ncbi:amidohydrolase [Oribacterium sp. oral taxon 102]|uniref:amidohydrolase family protein n=1 Tax=Oribacterium sp. oral taxon 102 TaxID=671214 RepID=UPI0015BA0057|nr:amidohydrolase [Oribacterium sp. oral taxon 102]NWO22090.1 amidohydrolase [Oribacterium sp. oral taxon 102]
MRIRFYHARILSMNGNMEPETGELWTDNEQITYLGPEVQEACPRFDREVDLRGNLLLPGFKNAHTHSAMTFLRSFADDLPLQEWLQKQVFPMEARLSGEDIYWFSRLAMMEYLTSGVTAAFDMYFHPEEMARASVDTGFRTVMVSGLNNFNSSLEELRENYLKFNAFHPLIRYQLGFHAEYTTSRELMEGIAALSRELQAPVFTHNSETKAEVEGCIARCGMTPTGLMEALGMLEYGGGGYHCVYMTDADLEVFRRHGMTVVSNPGSNTKLASGVPRTAEILRMGIPMAIGTDGPASNNCLDMFREMFLLTGLAKLRERDAAAVPAEEVLQMACVNGARCMGLPDCDCLAPGKLADLIVLDLQQPNMQPLNSIVKNIVYSGSKQNVMLTMIHGRILYENGRFDIGEEPERIYREANRRIARIKK